MERKRLSGLIGKNGKGLAAAAALALFALTALFYFFNILRCTAETPVVPTAIIYLSVACLAIGALICGKRMILDSGAKPEKVFTLFMIFAGVLYTAVFLPFTAPDEPSHYLSAYRVSNYLTLNFDQFGEERLLIRKADYELFASLRSTQLSPEYYSGIANGFEMFVSGAGASFIPAEFTCTAPFGYIASAFGIALGRMLHFGAIPTFYLGRMASLAVYILAVRFAIKRAPYGKTAFFVFGKCKHQRAVLFVLNAEIGTKSFKHFSTGFIKLCFQSAGFDRITGVDYCAVGLAGPLANVAFFF